MKSKSGCKYTNKDMINRFGTRYEAWLWVSSDPIIQKRFNFDSRFDNQIFFTELGDVREYAYKHITEKFNKDKNRLDSYLELWDIQGLVKKLFLTIIGNKKEFFESYNREFKKIETRYIKQINSLDRVNDEDVSLNEYYSEHKILDIGDKIYLVCFSKNGSFTEGFYEQEVRGVYPKLYLDGKIKVEYELDNGYIIEDRHTGLAGVKVYDSEEDAKTALKNHIDEKIKMYSDIVDSL